MAGSQFQFLHAGDLNLGRPLGGMCQVPEEWMDPLLEAPYRSSHKVFDLALRERVAFVVLTGDVICFSTAPAHAVEFLRDQLGRLEGAEIPVYWLDGKLEQAIPFPEQFPLPENVTRLVSGGVQRVELGGEPGHLVSLVSRPAGHDAADLKKPRAPGDGRFSVGLWYGGSERERDLGWLAQTGVDYWACGGRSNPLTLESAVPSRYCGTPQGRRPSQSGPHGCVLVQVDGGEIHPRFTETNTVRYQLEHLVLQGVENVAQVLPLMVERLREMRDAADDGPRLLVSWNIIDDGPVGRQLRQYEGNERLLGQIQRELHAADDSVWTIGVRSSRTPFAETLAEEDTFLGEFIRVVHQMHEATDDAGSIHSLLPDGEADKLAARVPLDDLLDRELLLSDAAAIGMDLLGGEES